MSHFAVFVFTKKNGASFEELLAPFDENIECEPYVKYTKKQAVAKVRKEIEEFKNDVYTKYLADPKKYEEENADNPEHIDYVKNIFPKRLNWSDKECYEYEKQFFNKEMIAKNGDLLSTYNPKSKWDWYTVGGRWKKFLKTTAGEFVDEAYVTEVDWNETIPFAFVTPDGKWHEKGEMGWWARVKNEKAESDWKNEFIEFVERLDSDAMVVVVDCHI